MSCIYAHDYTTSVSAQGFMPMCLLTPHAYSKQTLCLLVTFSCILFLAISPSCSFQLLLDVNVGTRGKDNRGHDNIA